MINNQVNRIIEAPTIDMIGNAFMANSEAAVPELKSISLNDIHEPLIFLVVSLVHINPIVIMVKKTMTTSQQIIDTMPRITRKNGKASEAPIKKVAIQDKTKKKVDHFFKASPFLLSSLDKSNGASIGAFSLSSI